MITKEQREMKIFNPFDDCFVDLVVYADLHRDSTYRLDAVDVSSIITEGGVELTDYLSQEKIDEISQEYLEIEVSEL